MRRLIIALLVLMPLAACGDDDTGADTEATDDTGADAEATDDALSDADGAESPETGSSIDPACPDAPFDFELQLAHTFSDAPNVPLGPFTFTDAVAVQVDETGGAFTVYLADHDLDPADFTGFFEPEVGPDQTLLTAFITAFNATEPLDALAAGDVIEGTDEFDVLTFNVIGQRGDDLYNSGSANGTIEILAVDGDHLCATIDFYDLVDQNDPGSEQQKIVRGSFTADVVLWDLAS